MPRYNYICLDCAKKVTAKHKKDLYDLTDDILEAEVLFETSHAMNPTDEELKEATECPRCGSTNAQITPHGASIHSYIRGYGWLDRAGAKRDMNMHALTQNDPYAEHRVPGEVDHIKNQLQKEGQHDPKTQHFSGPRSGDLVEEVKKATSS